MTLRLASTNQFVKHYLTNFQKIKASHPYQVAKDLRITILYRDFKKQRGAYKVILKNCFRNIHIFIASDTGKDAKIFDNEVAHTDSNSLLAALEDLYFKVWQYKMVHASELTCQGCDGDSLFKKYDYSISIKACVDC